MDAELRLSMPAATYASFLMTWDQQRGAAWSETKMLRAIFKC